MKKTILSKVSTEAPKNADKEKIKKETEKLVKEIGEWSEKLFAERKQSILIVLQGMDASGKDGIAKNVFSHCPPLVIDAHPFRKPTEEEMAHDFLWRVHKWAPGKGLIKIFIRSHYEDILIQRVHGWIDDERASLRLESINAFEKLLQYDANTTVLKFYLHISQKKQHKKLQERLEVPEKQWKYNPGDFEESKLWDRYMHYYEEVINGSAIPWHIVPVDHKWYRDYTVAKVVCEELRKMAPTYPTLPKE
ncbi:MAG: polyphosphate kinase [Saprospiraceae bacterium]|nr:polyphosphate kinase [Saprospiraceae bacterium]